MTVANSLWANPGESFVPAFLDTLAVDYGAGITLVSFANDPAGAASAINAWTSNETNGRIVNLLSPGAVDSATQLVLVDALYFDSSADFSGITGSRDLFIKDVFHQAFVAIDEDGTEAAAASAVVFEDGGAEPAPAVSVVADRPFLFAIRDLPTGTILFLGRVADPLG